MPKPDEISKYYLRCLSCLNCLRRLGRFRDGSGRRVVATAAEGKGGATCTDAGVLRVEETK